MPTTTEATIEDLYYIPEKAELVRGAIHTMSPTGIGPGYAAHEIFAALRIHSKRTGNGLAVGDNKGFRVNLPHRKSFSPDAAFYVGQAIGTRFFEGTPIFAAEVRSEGDYEPQAE
jgi:Uma2 family endonuclease